MSSHRSFTRREEYPEEFEVFVLFVFLDLLMKLLRDFVETLVPFKIVSKHQHSQRDKAQCDAFIHISNLALVRYKNSYADVRIWWRVITI
jgi:hypothetical protein